MKKWGLTGAIFRCIERAPNFTKIYTCNLRL